MHGSPRGHSSPRTCPRGGPGVAPRGRATRRTMSSESTAMPELIRLPGLDDVTVSTKPSGGHFIERTAGKRLMVVAGRSHLELAQKIAEHLGVELGAIELDTFANDETYVRYDESIRGTDLFLVQTGTP